MSIDDLKEKILFVTFYFSDGSGLTICTTLNKQILTEYEGSLVQGTFYDLIKKRYIAFRHDAVRVELFEDDPHLREVDIFANQFI